MTFVLTNSNRFPNCETKSHQNNEWNFKDENTLNEALCLDYFAKLENTLINLHINSIHCTTKIKHPLHSITSVIIKSNRFIRKCIAKLIEWTFSAEAKHYRTCVMCQSGNIVLNGESQSDCRKNIKREIHSPKKCHFPLEVFWLIMHFVKYET